MHNCLIFDTTKFIEGNMFHKMMYYNIVCVGLQTEEGLHTRCYNRSMYIQESLLGVVHSAHDRSDSSGRPNYYKGALFLRIS